MYMYGLINIMNLYLITLITIWNRNHTQSIMLYLFITQSHSLCLIFFHILTECPKAKFRKKNSITQSCLFFCHLLARKPNLEKISIYSNKFFYIFHLSESSLACLGRRGSGLTQRLVTFLCLSHARTMISNVICHVLSYVQLI